MKIFDKLYWSYRSYDHAIGWLHLFWLKLNHTAEITRVGIELQCNKMCLSLNKNLEILLLPINIIVRISADWRSKKTRWGMKVQNQIQFTPLEKQNFGLVRSHKILIKSRITILRYNYVRNFNLLHKSTEK